MKRSLAAWAVGVVPMSSVAAVAHAAVAEPAAATAEPDAAAPSDEPPAPTPSADAGGPPASSAPPPTTGGDAAASGSVSTAGVAADGSAKGAKSGKRRRTTNADFKTLPWIRRWAPQRNLGEIGISAGVFIPNEQHDLYDPSTRPSEPYWRAGADVSIRGGFYPLRTLGVEAEFNAMPTRVRSITNDFAFTYGFQSHVVFQLPYYSVVPFFLVGGGLLGVRSHPLIQGKDVDGALHYGGGVKIQFTKVIGVRVEARNIMSANEALQNAGGANIQVLGGITFTLGRRPPPPPPIKPPPPDPDRDKDGFANEVDECPDQAGVGPHGCPDSDGDGFRDAKDACPEVPGVEPDGCPVKDTDNDGFLDPDDDCVFEPETKNDYKDHDGCPDELPPEVKKFSGTIDGIEFDTKKDTIRPISRPLLDKAVAVLDEFKDIHVKIIGHTDDVGAPEFNLDLSKRRAEAVKKYLVDKGIDPARITTEGRGMTDPRVPNDSDANRAKNRRIDFEVRTIEQPTPGKSPDAPTDPSAAPATPATKPDPDAP